MIQEISRISRLAVELAAIFQVISRLIVQLHLVNFLPVRLGRVQEALQGVWYHAGLHAEGTLLSAELALVAKIFLPSRDDALHGAFVTENFYLLGGVVASLGNSLLIHSAYERNF
jgi:hypothetical protein